MKTAGKMKVGANKKAAPKVPVKVALKRGPVTLDSEEARRRINIRWARPGAREAQSKAVRARLELKAQEEAEAAAAKIRRKEERAAKRAAAEAQAKLEAAKARRKAAALRAAATRRANKAASADMA